MKNHVIPFYFTHPSSPRTYHLIFISLFSHYAEIFDTDMISQKIFFVNMGRSVSLILSKNYDSIIR